MSSKYCRGVWFKVRVSIEGNGVYTSYYKEQPLNPSTSSQGSSDFQEVNSIIQRNIRPS